MLKLEPALSPGGSTFWRRTPLIYNNWVAAAAYRRRPCHSADTARARRLATQASRLGLRQPADSDCGKVAAIRLRHTTTSLRRGTGMAPPSLTGTGIADRHR